MRSDRSIAACVAVRVHDEPQVWAAAEMLGFERDRLTSINTTRVYARYGLDLGTIADLRFE
ncbi:hypothetical protein [Streptomyces sp. TP-A0874]|uniref:hypothetical protein n=1 Tax=Streptomyces sp. TP-A0874 TaxID=549819 RepID=UPI0035B54EAE